MHTLNISHLQKEYPNGIKALQDVSLTICNGMFGLLGPNGAGKSSLMRTIVGLQKADQGQIIFNGVNVAEDPLYMKCRLGYLPQDFGVYPKISAYDLLDHIAILKGVLKKTERRDQIFSLLDRMNLLAHKNKWVHNFSGGMKQRFGVAQALLGNPIILIVDEPTAGLDPEERNRFNGLLSEIGQERIVILSTHLVDDVQNLCSNMAIIKAGKVLVNGRPDDFVQSLEGKIWRKRIDKQQLEEYKQAHRVIASQYIGGDLHIQVFADVQPPGFDPLVPGLEQVYFNAIN
ncbi:MAG: ABC transporter ATP-binding protein [Chitinophagaceae bacterium]